MNPMDLFNQNELNGLPFNEMSQSQYAPEYLHEMKKMVKQYQAVLNDEFWESIYNLSSSKKKNIQILPIEIWENDENLYLAIMAPGLPHLNDAKITFQNDHIITLKIKSHSIKPEGAISLIISEVPQQSYEREIFLQKPVASSDYTVSHVQGILIYTFKKIENELEIPVEF